MNEFIADHMVELGVAVAGVAVLAGLTWLVLARRGRRKSAERDRNLREHFEDLLREAEPVISLASGVGQQAGKVVATDRSDDGSVTLRGIRTARLSDCFRAHFPEQWRRWAEWERRASEHNRTCEDLRRGLKAILSAKGIRVEKSRESRFDTCLYETALDLVLEYWRKLARGEHLQSGTEVFRTERSGNGYLLYAPGWNATGAIGFVMDGSDPDGCTEALAELSEGMERRREGGELLVSADELVGEGRELAKDLTAELRGIKESWPGGKGRRFRKRPKSCPRCKEIV